MGIRHQTITPFQSGQDTAGPREKAESVEVKFKVPFMKRNGQPDPLKQALTSPPREFMDTRRFTKIPPAPKGRQYKPHWAQVERTGKGQGVYSYGGAPNHKGENAVGRNVNRSGGNALGRALGGRGSNPLGSPPNRKGTNTNGSPRNRMGQNALPGAKSPAKGTFHGAGQRQ